ncbi:MAG: hypothetical protein JNK75_11510 [Betaproteobacteria bacterium]|nr:hypothetical protein [Betaproteobacteria bacterium]
MSLQHALEAHGRPVVPGGSPMTSTVLTIGNAGALGEAVLARLLASPRYRGVVAATTQHLHTSVPRLSATAFSALFDVAGWQAATGGEASRCDAVILVDGKHSFLKRDDAFPVVPLGEAIKLAQAARQAGVTRLLAVSPMDPWSGMTLGSLVHFDELERALVSMGFETLIMVRPSEYRNPPRVSGDLLKWLASMLLGTLGHYMTTSSRMPLRPHIVAEAAVEWLTQLPAGMHRQDAVVLHEWVRAKREGR